MFGGVIWQNLFMQRKALEQDLQGLYRFQHTNPTENFGFKVTFKLEYITVQVT